MRLCWGKKSILVVWMQIYIAETGGDCDVEAGGWLGRGGSGWGVSGRIDMLVMMVAGELRMGLILLLIGLIIV